MTMPVNCPAPNDFLSRATALVDRGFSVIPLAPRAKGPVGPGARSRTRDAEVVKAWAEMWPDANVGICADENITILESDDAARFRETLKNMGVELPETMTGGASENRPHWFLKRTAECGEDCITVPTLFEFRNRNQYVVGPGSIHPSGAEYRWWNDAPIVPMPADLVDALRTLMDEYGGSGYGDGEPHGEHIKTGPYAKLRSAYTRRGNPADLLKIEGLEVGEDERHYTLMSLAGILHDGKRSADDIAEILREVRDKYFSTGGREVSNAEVLRAADYAVSKEPYYFEPWDLPIAYSIWPYMFSTKEAMEEWVRAHRDDFSVSWGVFATEDMPEQQVLITLDKVPLIREQTVNEILAFRGVGKSMLVASLIKILTEGGEFAGFESFGGKRVLLVDGELPPKLLQDRLKQIVGVTARTAELLRLRTLAQVKNRMAALADPVEQDRFFKWVAGPGAWRPDVIIFDTRTAVFKHDTNNQEQLLAVNDFQIRLRAEGFVIIIAHHAGKNNTQRGRTDNDDITDLIMQLNKRPGWKPGMGLEFSLEFEKVRYADRHVGFDAKMVDGQWQRLGVADNEVVQLLLQGLGTKQVARTLKVGDGTVLEIKKRAEAAGTQFPVLKSGTKSDEDKKQRALELADLGKSQHAIADELGVTQPAVSKWLRDRDNKVITAERVN